MHGTYNPLLVALSFLLAMAASYTSFELAARVRAAAGRLLWLWLIGGACALGAGIWSMHFVGMLAFQLPVPMGYDLALTLLSLLIAIVASAGVFWLMRMSAIRQAAIALGAVLAGIGIVSMHYTGMAAMRMSPPIDYDPWLVAASFLIAVVAARAALWIEFQVRRDGLLGAIVTRQVGAAAMGVAITGMHYTGMAAAGFAPGSVSLAANAAHGMDHLTLAAIIALVTFITLFAALGTSAFNARLADEKARLAESLKAVNQQLLRDPLTNLPGRVLLMDRLQLAIQRARRSDTSCACLVIDLDAFKPVNDTLGHRAGDEVLQEVAARLEGCLRGDDTAARIGGDEFVVIVNGIASATQLADVAARIVSALSWTLTSGPRPLEIAASVGIALCPADGLEPLELLDRADRAMYRAKQNGGNSYAFYAPVQAADAASSATG